MQDEKAEQDFAIVSDCAEKIRSLAGVYNLRTGLQSEHLNTSPEYKAKFQSGRHYSMHQLGTVQIA